ncbi:hypothetical protein [Acinetobacter calcoaceticus]|nr:hypothetical protein [Acinetobacter calcoaceticus]GLG83623.1 hypothetical protein ACSO1_21450 [Acinetobacter calcoaceticus]
MESSCILVGFLWESFIRGMPNIPNFKGLTEAGLDAGLTFGGSAID